MKLKTLPGFLIVLTLASWLSACGSIPGTSKGIELGNPEGEVIPVRIMPMDGEAIYEMRVLDSDRASLSRVVSSGEQTEIVDFQREGDWLKLFAQFPGKENVALQLQFDERGKILSGILKIDGRSTAASFEELVDKSAPQGKGETAHEAMDQATSFNEVDPDAAVPERNTEFGDAAPDRVGP